MGEASSKLATLLSYADPFPSSFENIASKSILVNVGGLTVFWSHTKRYWVTHPLPSTSLFKIRKHPLRYSRWYVWRIIHDNFLNCSFTFSSCWYDPGLDTMTMTALIHYSHHCMVPKWKIEPSKFKLCRSNVVQIIIKKSWTSIIISCTKDISKRANVRRSLGFTKNTEGMYSIIIFEVKQLQTYEFMI